MKWVLIPFLSQLIQQKRLKVPEDLSVITFDQHPGLTNWLGVLPTCLKMPLIEMGRRLAHMARDIVNGKPVEPSISLPCQLVEGESVKTL